MEERAEEPLLGLGRTGEELGDRATARRLRSGAARSPDRPERRVDLEKLERRAVGRRREVAERRPADADRPVREGAREVRDGDRAPRPGAQREGMRRGRRPSRSAPTSPRRRRTSGRSRRGASPPIVAPRRPSGQAVVPVSLSTTRRSASTPTTMSTRKTRTEMNPRWKSGTSAATSTTSPSNGAVGPERACGDGSDVTAGPDSEPRRSGEPDAQEREEPEDDPEPRTVGEPLGDDAPRVGPRRLGRVRRQRVDQIRAEEPADEQQQESRDQEADRECPELDAPPAAREPDGQRGERDRDEPEPVRESLEDAGSGLRRLELVGADDRDLARRLGKLLWRSAR